MTDDYIIDVSDESFELEVVNYSAHVPGGDGLLGALVHPLQGAVAAACQAGSGSRRRLSAGARQRR
jgi:hypothetical protein